MAFTSDDPVSQNMSSWSRVKRGSPLAQFLHYAVQQNPLIREWPEVDNAILVHSVIDHLIRGSTPEQIADHLDNIVATAGLGPKTSKTQEFSQWLFDTMNCWLFEEEKEWLSKRSQATGGSSAVGSSSNVSSDVENPSVALPPPEQRMARSPTPDLHARSVTIAAPSSVDNMFADLIDKNERLIVTYSWIKSPLNILKTGLTSTKLAMRKHIQDAEDSKLTAQRLSLEALTSLKQEEIKNKKLNKCLEALESQFDEKKREIAERNAKVTTLQYEIRDLKATVKKVMDTADELYAWKLQAIDNRCEEIEEAKAEIEEAIEKAIDDTIDKSIERGFGSRLMRQFAMQELSQLVVSPEQSVDVDHNTASENLPRGDNNTLSCISEQFGTSESVSKVDDSPEDGEVRSVTMPHGEQEDVWYDKVDDIWRNDLGVSGHIGPNMTFVPLSPSPTPEPKSSVRSQAEMDDSAETENIRKDAASASQFRPFEYHKCPDGHIFFARWDEEQQIWETDRGDLGCFDTEGNFHVFCENSDSHFQYDNFSEVEDQDEEHLDYESDSEGDNESDKAEEWECDDEENFPEEDLNGSFDCGDYSNCQPTLSSEAEDEELPDYESLSGQGDESPGYDHELPAWSLPSATPQISDVPRSSNDMIANLAPTVPQLDNWLERMISSLKRSADHDPLELPNAKRQRPNEDQATNILLSNPDAMMRVDTRQETEVESSNGDSEDEDEQEMISYLAYLLQRIRLYFAQYADISTKFLNIYGSHHTIYETAIKDLKQRIGAQLTRRFHKMVLVLTQNIRSSNRHYITTIRANLYALAAGDVHENAERFALTNTKDRVVGEVLQECVRLFNAVLKGVGCGSSMKAHVKIVYTEGPEFAEVVVL